MFVFSLKTFFQSLHPYGPHHFYLPVPLPLSPLLCIFDSFVLSAVLAFFHLHYFIIHFVFSPTFQALFFFLFLLFTANLSLLFFFTLIVWSFFVPFLKCTLLHYFFHEFGLKIKITFFFYNERHSLIPVFL